MSYRSKWMDPDFRREAKTSRYCEQCQRDLTPGQPHRRVLFDLARYEAVHADEWEAARAEDPAREWREGLIGMDCAARLGTNWSRPAKDN